jgi:ABC-type Fe3+ transport system substrate-binding protein
MYGGGVPAFERIKHAGCAEPVNVSADVLEAIPPELAGVELRDPENHWFGVALSSFGIIYNKNVLKTRGMDEPVTWEDLTDPAYLGNLVLADPSKSSSASVCYEVILQKPGWEAGWALLVKIAGNTREFTARSSTVPNEVGQGSAMAGLCIDFYGYT